MKRLLLRNISRANLTTEELETIAIESRPLAALSTDPNDGKAHTQAHLLIGDTLTC